jgi:hypothetical protein
MIKKWLTRHRYDHLSYNQVGKTYNKAWFNFKDGSTIIGDVSKFRHVQLEFVELVCKKYRIYEHKIDVKL